MSVIDAPVELEQPTKQVHVTHLFPRNSRTSYCGYKQQRGTWIVWDGRIDPDLCKVCVDLVPRRWRPLMWIMRWL